MENALLVMAGGSLGALSRYLISLLAVSLFGTGFPWGTLIVNHLGCLLIGFLLTLAERNLLIGPSLRLFMVTGFLGAMTTFSTYAWESVRAVGAGDVRLAGTNFVVNNLVGFLLVILGIYLAKRV